MMPAFWFGMAAIGCALMILVSLESFPGGAPARTALTFFVATTGH